MKAHKQYINTQNKKMTLIKNKNKNNARKHNQQCKKKKKK
jgi:hypothetical protein